MVKNYGASCERERPVSVPLSRTYFPSWDFLKLKPDLLPEPLGLQIVIIKMEGPVVAISSYFISYRSYYMLH
jgi:hypothetical protein